MVAMGDLELRRSLDASSAINRDCRAMDGKGGSGLLHQRSTELRAIQSGSIALDRRFSGNGNIPARVRHAILQATTVALAGVAPFVVSNEFL